MEKKTSKLKNEIKEIRSELREIKKDLEEIKKRFDNGQDEIDHMLKRRGYACLRRNPMNRLILPRDTDRKTEDFFYDLMKKYSFRIFLRDVIKLKKSFKIDDLTRYCNEETARNYISILLEASVLKAIDSSRYTLLSDSVISFGDTLEWFVAKVFEKEFHSPSSWGISMRNTQTGGDFDVISFVEGNFIYTEVKSSPPKHIEINEVASFLNRVEDLRPDLSLFFEDTQLRLRDKIVPMFQEEWKRRYGGDKRKRFTIQCLSEEGDNIFYIDRNIFIINSRPDIITNIGLLLRFLLQNRNSVINTGGQC